MLISRKLIPCGQWHFPSLLDDSLHLSPMPRMTMVGRDEVKDHRYHFHGLKREKVPYAIFQLTLAGEGRLRCGGKTYSCREGQVFVVPVPHDHEYDLPPTSPFWEVLFINLSGESVVREAYRMLDEHGPVFDLNQKTLSKLVLEVVDIFHLAIHHVPLSRHSESMKAWSLLMNLFDGSRPTGDQKQSWSTVMKDHIISHLQEDLSVERLAQFANYSPFHFSRKFKEEIGQSPSEFVRTARMQMAHQMLANSRYCIKEVCSLTGFKDQSHFSKVFKATHGLSPKAFQRDIKVSLVSNTGI